jgi:hypothetical protein
VRHGHAAVEVALPELLQRAADVQVKLSAPFNNRHRCPKIHRLARIPKTQRIYANFIKKVLQ